MKPQSAKAKGRRLQQRLAADVVSLFPTLQADDVTSRSSGATGSDLLLSPAAANVFPYSLEAKNVEKVNVWQSWEQAVANAGRESREPLLVLARNATPPLAVVSWDHLMLLAARASQPR
jgi:hypothetical protein